MRNRKCDNRMKVRQSHFVLTAARCIVIVELLMKRLLPALFALCVMPAFADYFSDRTAGMELFNAGKFQEAADGFLKLGESKNDIQQADALTNAAICLQRMQRADEAMALAGKIRSEPMAMACRIDLLRKGRQWAELLKLAEAQDFTVWPEKLIYPAFLARGQAHAALRQSDAAEADFLRAEASTLSPDLKAQAWVCIAENAGEPQKALDAYAKVCQLAPGGGTLQRALYARAKLLADQKAWDQALAEVALLEKAQNKDPYWICTTHLAYGYIYEKQGKPAIESYRNAAAVPKAPDDLVKAANAKIAALEGAAPGGTSAEKK